MNSPKIITVEQAKLIKASLEKIGLNYFLEANLFAVEEWLTSKEKELYRDCITIIAEGGK